MNKIFRTHFLAITLTILFLLLSGCANRQTFRDGPPAYNVDVSRIPNAVPKYEPKSPYGNASSYVVHGRRYHVLRSAANYHVRGMASWYGSKFHGHYTSTRERYNMLAMTAASPVLPIPCYARVTNLRNGKQIIVKVNDRGPFAANRVMDLSYVAAKKLGYVGNGTAYVQIDAIVPGHQNLAPAPIQFAQRATAPSHQHRIYLQLGAFHNFANAAQLKDRIAHLTLHEVSIHSAAVHQDKVYKVQIGPLLNTELAQLENKISHAGLGHAMPVVG